MQFLDAISCPVIQLQGSKGNVYKDKIAMKQSDLDAWKLLQKAKVKLLDNFFGQTQYAA